MRTVFGVKFMKQANMRKVLIATLPLIIASIYFYGWRCLILLLVNTLAAIITEYLFKRKNNKPVTEAVLVSATLYTLVLPASMPYWFSVVGIVFGIVFGKEAFGGFGRNVFNPALVGRAFVYVSFPNEMTGSWNHVASGFPGGFTQYLTQRIDVIAEATPMLRYQSTGAVEGIKSLLIGNISGSIGETSKILILLALVYLLVKKVIFRENVIGMLAGFVGMSLLFRVLGVESVAPLQLGLFSGGFLFALTFMITDPISSAKTKPGKYIYGAIAGIITVVIRSFAIFPGGVMFAILIANMFGPIIDEAAKALQKKRKEAKVG